MKALPGILMAAIALLGTGAASAAVCPANCRPLRRSRPPNPVRACPSTPPGSASRTTRAWSRWASASTLMEFRAGFRSWDRADTRRSIIRPRIGSSILAGYQRPSTAPQRPSASRSRFVLPSIKTPRPARPSNQTKPADHVPGGVIVRAAGPVQDACRNPVLEGA